MIYGQRTRRDDGWRRVLASAILRSTLLLVARANCLDANVPYRLIYTKGLITELQKIPNDFSLGNVALAVLLRRAGRREGRVPIRFRERYGGEPSVAMATFLSKAMELCKQLRLLDRSSSPDK